MVAFLYDLIIIAPVTAVIDFAFEESFLGFLSLHVLWVYRSSLHAWLGQTVGKRALGLRVVHDGAANLPVRAAVVREFPWILGAIGGSGLWFLETMWQAHSFHTLHLVVVGIFTGVIMLDLLWVALDPSSRALHDVVSGTSVESIRSTAT